MLKRQILKCQILNRMYIAMGAAIWLTACSAPSDDHALDADVQSGKSGTENIQLVTSAGGITAWLINEPSIEIVAMQFDWRGGRAIDPEGMEGAVSLMSYMMNEGAGDLDSKAFITRMEELNMSFGCSVGNDWTSCSMRTLSKNIAPAFDMVGMALSKTRFDDEPFARAQREYQVSLKREETNPAILAGRAMNAALIPGHPYARYQTPESIATITREVLIERRDTLMTQDRLLVVAVGDISADALSILLDKTFSGLPQSADIPTIDEAVFQPATEAPIIIPLPQPQSRIQFTAPGLKYEHPDFYAALVTNYILGGGGFSSRLMDELREKRGLTYGIYTSLSASQHSASWGGSAQTKNESAAEFVELTRAEIARLRDEGPREAELVDAKAYLTGSYALGFDSNAKMASRLMNARRHDLGREHFAKRNSYIEAVSMEDVKRVANTYLAPENFTFVIVGQPEGF